MAELASISARIDGLVRRYESTRRESVAQIIPDADTLHVAAFAELEAARLAAAGTQAPAPSGLQLPSPSERLARATRDEARIASLRGTLLRESQDVEIRHANGAGLCGVYNEETGRAEWRREALAGVTGTYNPTTRSIDWVVAPREAVAVAQDPATSAVFEKRNAAGGVAGIFDNAMLEPHFESREGRGIGMLEGDGAFDARTHEVPGQPVVGYLENGERRFATSPTDAIAVIYRDREENTYRSQCAYYPPGAARRPAGGSQ
ncbi:MAG: hypothetical protein ACAI38_20610 [Myxococcota bacterium]|nr:hypothetical protein [Myxococcota bacterium]